MDDTPPVVNPHEQARQALLATLAAARTNPNGKDVADYLTKLLAEMEGIGGSEATGMTLDDESTIVPQHTNRDVVELEDVEHPSSILTAAETTIADTPVTHLWEMPADAAAKKRQEMESLWEALEREEDEWLKKQAAPEDVQPGTSKEAISSTTPNAPVENQQVDISDRSRPKKSVKFEDGTTPNRSDSADLASPNWGDVVPATLKSRGKPTAQATPVMRFNVVERTPSTSSVRSPRMAKDSDDEDSEEEDGASDDGSVERDSDDEARPLHGDSGSESEGPNEQVSDSDADELGEAHANAKTRRQALLHDSAQRTSPRERTTGEAGSEWVPLDASATEEPHQNTAGPSSRFKAMRTGPASVPVTALGPGARGVVREGKLVDGKLVVPADTDSDKDGDELGEAGRRTIELLRKRDLGSDGVEHSGPLNLNKTQENLSTIPAAGGTSVLGDVQERTPSASTSKRNPSSTKLSRFKATQHRTTPKSVLQRMDEAAQAASDQMIATLSAQYRPASTQASLSPPSVSVTSPNDTTTFPVTIMETPAFPGPVEGSAAGPKRGSAMMSDVKERQSSTKSTPAGDGPPKVSRFKANRM